MIHNNNIKWLSKLMFGFIYILIILYKKLIKIETKQMDKRLKKDNNY
jgi:hypothetical protein